MKIFYIYPEIINKKAAREISCINTFYELSKICNAKFITAYSEKNIDDLNETFDIELKKEDIIFLNRKFLFISSSKIFNWNLKKVIKNADDDSIFYTRHIKIGAFLLKHKKPYQKVVFEVHQCEGEMNPNVKEFEKSFLQKCDCITSHNKGTLEFVARFYNIEFKKSYVIYNGVKRAKEYIPKKFDFSKITYSGSFIAWKGLGFLLKFIQRHPELSLCIYGNDKSKNGENFKSLLQNSPAKNRVEIAGYKSSAEILSILKENTNLLIITNDETLSTPLKLFEYLSFGNIVIVPNYPTILEVVKDGFNGFVYSGGDIKSLEETYKKVAGLSESEILRVSQNAYEDCKRYYWENRAKKILNICEEISGRK